jgi:hypothetical protein
LAELAKPCKQFDVRVPPRRQSVPAAYKPLADGRHRAAGCTGMIWSARPLFFAVARTLNERASL